MTTRIYRDPAVLVNQPVPTVRDIVNSLSDTFDFVRPYITTETGDYTTSGRVAHEVVKCTGSSAQTVTLHSNPTDGQRVTIKRIGSGAVTISGTIDGAASSSIGPGVGLQLIYIDDSTGEWSAI